MKDAGDPRNVKGAGALRNVKGAGPTEESQHDELHPEREGAFLLRDAPAITMATVKGSGPRTVCKRRGRPRNVFSSWGARAHTHTRVPSSHTHTRVPSSHTHTHTHVYPVHTHTHTRTQFTHTHTRTQFTHTYIHVYT